MADPKANTSPAPTGPSSKRRSLGSEFVDYLMQNKKWWMIPIILMVLLLALVLILSGTPAMTFIYPLF